MRTRMRPHDSMALMKRSLHREPFAWKNVFRLPVFLLANAAIFMIIGASTLREAYRGLTVEHEIRGLEAQAEALEGRESKLTQLTAQLSSPDQVEYDARRQLGWKKDGEQVVVLTGYQDPTTSTSNNAELLASSQVTSPPSNITLWWRYFSSPRTTSN